VLLGVFGLILVGAHSVRNLDVEADPDSTPPPVEVITKNAVSLSRRDGELLDCQPQ